ncbi:MAG: hypothetical protein KAT53_09650 [Dehalococcoidia bacterium]|nr:hypothetical protein [Dehalococcoidia bacterium]
MVKKKFVTYSGPEFLGGEKAKIVTMDFFTEENGFMPPEIRDIGRMEQNDTLNVGPLKVWRVV